MRPADQPDRPRRLEILPPPQVAPVSELAPRSSGTVPPGPMMRSDRHQPVVTSSVCPEARQKPHQARASSTAEVPSARKDPPLVGIGDRSSSLKRDGPPLKELTGVPHVNVGTIFTPNLVRPPTAALTRSALHLGRFRLVLIGSVPPKKRPAFPVNTPAVEAHRCRHYARAGRSRSRRRWKNDDRSVPMDGRSPVCLAANAPGRAPATAEPPPFPEWAVTALQGRDDASWEYGSLGSATPPTSFGRRHLTTVADGAGRGEGTAGAGSRETRTLAPGAIPVDQSSFDSRRDVHLGRAVPAGSGIELRGNGDWRRHHQRRTRPAVLGDCWYACTVAGVKGRCASRRYATPLAAVRCLLPPPTWPHR